VTGGNIGDVLGGDVTLDRGAGGKDNFTRNTPGQVLLEQFQPQLLRPITVQRRELAEQHEITPAISRRRLDSDDIGRGFDDTQNALVTLGIQADITNIAVTKITALLTVPYIVQRAAERLRDASATLLITFEQMQRHALRRLATHARQASERLDEFIETGRSHRLKRQLEPGRQVQARGHFLHRSLVSFFDLVNGIVDRRRDQVLEHFKIFANQ